MPRSKERRQPKPESQLDVIKKLSDWKDQFPDRNAVIAIVQLRDGTQSYFGYIEPEVTFAAPPISEAMAAYYPALAPYRKRQTADLEAMIGRFQAFGTLSQKLKDTEGQEVAFAHHLAQVQPDDVKVRLRDASATLFEKRLLPDDWGYYGAKSFIEKRSEELAKSSVKVDLRTEQS